MTTVTTTYGAIEGVERGRHHAFLGVPFGAPTSGGGRFAAPRPPEAWAGTRAATAFADSAPQGDHAIGGFASSGPRSEECLNLNVYTPEADGARRPVMVWIHGGGYTHGSGSELLYDGGPLAERGDVVVVTIHYRLGALGYVDLSDDLEGATANAGLLDQVAALRWVHENIEAFGGDPGSVTVFGESAGAAAVGMLLVTPSARGLFHRAILQSGTGRATATDGARQLADQLLGALGLDRSSAAQARDVPWEAIVEAQGKLGGAQAGGALRFGPVCDGEVLPATPREAVTAGAASEIPVLLGTNRDEVKLFNAGARDRPPIEDNALPRAIGSALPGASDEDLAGIIENYRRSREAMGLPTANVDIFDAVTSDARFRIPATRMALAQREHQPAVHLYLFDWESPARRGALGACHALEMPFVFGTLHAPTQDRFAGSGPEAERLSQQMMDAWIAFARTGNPAHEGIGEWPAYEAETRPTMVFGRNTRLESDPLGEERRAVAPFVP